VPATEAISTAGRKALSRERLEEEIVENIIIGFDGSDEARDALCIADRMSRLETATLTVAIVGLFEPQNSSDAEAARSARSRRAIFERVEADLDGRRYEPRVIEGLPVAHGLIELAQEEDADMLVVGSTHRGRVGQVFPGSIGAQLLHGAPCPVTIAPRGYRDAPPPVRGALGVAYDGSQESELALGLGESLAQLLELDVRLVGVVPQFELLDVPRPEALAERARWQAEWLRKLTQRCDDVDTDLVAEVRLLDGDAGPALAEASKELDLLVMGSRGRGWLARTVLGSVSAHVCSHAACPVVVVPRAAEPAGARAGLARSSTIALA
jgi:nucleotide-binding universal stress UspA family protein